MEQTMNEIRAEGFAEWYMKKSAIEYTKSYMTMCARALMESDFTAVVDKDDLISKIASKYDLDDDVARKICEKVMYEFEQSVQSKEFKALWRMTKSYMELIQVSIEL